LSITRAHQHTSEHISWHSPQWFLRSKKPRSLSSRTRCWSGFVGHNKHRFMRSLVKNLPALYLSRNCSPWTRGVPPKGCVCGQSKASPPHTQTLVALSLLLLRCSTSHEPDLIAHNNQHLLYSAVVPGIVAKHRSVTRSFSEVTWSRIQKRAQTCDGKTRQRHHRSRRGHHAK
jgi:hypothetical protein